MVESRDSPVTSGRTDCGVPEKSDASVRNALARSAVLILSTVRVSALNAG